MAPRRENGIICINTALLDLCQGCLWLEWDPINQICLNRLTPLCSCQQNELPPLATSEAEPTIMYPFRTRFCRLP